MTEKATPRASYAVGDLVIPDADQFGGRMTPGVHRITKAPRTAREVNYVTEPVVEGLGRGVRAPAFALLPFEGTEEEAKNYKAPAATVVAFVPTPPAGTIVTVKGIKKIDPDRLYVVQGPAKKLNCARLAALGGIEGDRYWPAIPLSALTVIPLERITVNPA